MVKRKPIEYVICLIVIVILVVFNIILSNISNSPSYVVKYFINPVFLYIPIMAFDIAVILCIINFLNKKYNSMKIIAIAFVSIVIVYLTVCFSTLVHSKTKSFDELYYLKSVSKQICDSLFGEYNNEIEEDYRQDTLYAFGDSLLFETSNTYDIKSSENSGSCFIDILCFDNYPVWKRQKLINQLENTYFYSEYAYSLSNRVFNEDDIFSGAKEDVLYQYCCIRSTNDEVLKNSIYFSMLLEDSNSVFLVSILIHQKEYMDVNVEKALENILITTEQLWESYNTETNKTSNSVRST